MGLRSHAISLINVGVPGNRGRGRGGYAFSSFSNNIEGVNVFSFLAPT